MWFGLLPGYLFVLTLAMLVAIFMEVALSTISGSSKPFTFLHRLMWVSVLFTITGGCLYYRVPVPSLARLRFLNSPDRYVGWPERYGLDQCCDVFGDEVLWNVSSFQPEPFCRDLITALAIGCIVALCIWSPSRSRRLWMRTSSTVMAGVVGGLTAGYDTLIAANCLFSFGLVGFLVSFVFLCGTLGLLSWCWWVAVNREHIGRVVLVAGVVVLCLGILVSWPKTDIKKAQPSHIVPSPLPL